MTEEELSKVDWGMYLDEEQIDEEDNKRQLMLGNEEDNDQIDEVDLMPDWKKECNKKYKSKNNSEKNGGELVISFDTGFSAGRTDNNHSKKLIKNKDIPSLKKQKKTQK